MDIFIYSRKSVDTQKGDSLENQVAMCKAYLTAKIPEAGTARITVYEDEGFSAKNTDRPQFQQMLRDLARHKPAYLVCYRLDRISRNVSDFAAFIERLNREGIAFLCIKEEFDTARPMGKAMMYLASVFAQLERETIAERVRDNMRLLARTGRWLGGSTPTGFVSEPMREPGPDGKLRCFSILRVDPDEMMAADTIFRKFWELHSLSGVARYLAQAGVRSRTGNPFSRTAIREILQNPVYCAADRDAKTYFAQHGCEVFFGEDACTRGLLAYNKRDYRQKNARRLPMSEWIVAAGHHPARVSGKRWAAIQQLLQRNVPAGKRASPVHNDYALLSGLLFCGRCQHRLFAKPRGAKRDGFDYICGSKLQGGTALCGCQNLGGTITDALVWETLLPYARETANLEHLLRAYRRTLPKTTPASNPPSIAHTLADWPERAGLLTLPEKRTLVQLLTERIIWDGTELHLFLRGR